MSRALVSIEMETTMITIIEGMENTPFITDYFKTNGSVCPICGSDILDSKKPIVNPDCTIAVKVGCAECHNIWTEIYTLSEMQLSDGLTSNP